MLGRRLYHHEIAHAEGYGSDIFLSRYMAPRRAAEARIKQCGPNTYPDGRYRIGGYEFAVYTAGGLRIFDWFPEDGKLNVNRLEAFASVAEALRAWRMPRFFEDHLLELVRE